MRCCWFETRFDVIEEGRNLVPSQMWHAFYAVGPEGSDLHYLHCIIFFSRSEE